MPVTVKGMIENFLSVVKRYGFVPNGGRVYYLSRSQPPLLIPMVRTLSLSVLAFVSKRPNRSYRDPVNSKSLPNDLPFFYYCFLRNSKSSLNDANIFQVSKYYEFTSDLKFLKNNIALLEREFKYWQNEKTVDVRKNGKTYKMARYVVNSHGPRPESYK